MSSRVHVGNIPFRAGKRDIEEFFHGYRVHDIELGHGFAIVQLDSADATDAVRQLNDLRMMGRRISVNYARRGFVAEHRGSSRSRFSNRRPSRSRSPHRQRRSRSRSPHRRPSRSRSPHRQRPSRSRSPHRQRRSRSRSPHRQRRSRSRSPHRQRRSRSRLQHRRPLRSRSPHRQHPRSHRRYTRSPPRQSSPINQLLPPMVGNERAAVIHSPSLSSLHIQEKHSAGARGGETEGDDATTTRYDLPQHYMQTHMPGYLRGLKPGGASSSRQSQAVLPSFGFNTSHSVLSRPNCKFNTSLGGLSSSASKGAFAPTTLYGAASAKELLLHSTVVFDPTEMIVDLSMYQCPLRGAIYFPPEFGAPMTASVLEAYFQIHPVERKLDGESVLLYQAPTKEEVSETANHKLFASFNPPLKIMEEKHEKIRMEHCGSHPVMLVDFSSVHGSDPADIISNIKEAIVEAFAKHSYLVDHFQKIIDTDGTYALKQGKSNRTAVLNAKQHMREFNYITEWRNNDAAHMNSVFPTSLSKLATCLHEHFNKRDVFVFIVGYDKPYTCSLGDYMEVDRLYTFYQPIIKNLLRLEAVKIALFFGIDPLSELCLSNLKQWSYPRNVGYGRYIGVSEEALKAFLKCHSINPTEAVLKLFADECGCYPVSYRSSTGKEVAYKILSTSDIVRLVERYHSLGAPKEDGAVAKQVEMAIEAQAKERGRDALKVLGAFDGFFGHSDISDALTDLVFDTPIEFELNVSYGLQELRKLKSAANDSSQQPTKHAFALFFTQHFQYGYLIELPLFKNHFMLPNQKAKRYFASKIANYYQEKWDIDIGAALEVSRKLIDLFDVKGDSAQRLKNALKRTMECLLQTMKPFKKIKAENVGRGIHSGEDFVHSLVNVLMSIHVSVEFMGSEVEWTRLGTMEEKVEQDVVKQEEKKRYQDRPDLLGKHINGRAMALEMKFEADDLENAKKQCRRYGRYFVRYPQEGVETVVFVVVDVRENKEVQVEIETRSIAQVKDEFPDAQPTHASEVLGQGGDRAFGSLMETYDDK